MRKIIAFIIPFMVCFGALELTSDVVWWKQASLVALGWFVGQIPHFSIWANEIKKGAQ